MAPTTFRSFVDSLEAMTTTGVNRFYTQGPPVGAPGVTDCPAQFVRYPAADEPPTEPLRIVPVAPPLDTPTTPLRIVAPEPSETDEAQNRAEDDDRHETAEREDDAEPESRGAPVVEKVSGLLGG